MTNDIFFQSMVACFIGNIIHLCAKWASLAKDYKTANLPFNLKIWWDIDKFAFLLDFAASMGLVYLANEWIDSEYVVGKIKTLFVLIGFTGSYAIMYLTSRAKRAPRAKADEATNIVDGKTN